MRAGLLQLMILVVCLSRGFLQHRRANMAERIKVLLLVETHGGAKEHCITWSPDSLPPNSMQPLPNYFGHLLAVVFVYSFLCCCSGLSMYSLHATVVVVAVVVADGVAGLRGCYTSR